MKDDIEILSDAVKEGSGMDGVMRVRKDITTDDAIAIQFHGFEIVLHESGGTRGWYISDTAD